MVSKNKKKQQAPRRTIPTILFVGEGKTEVAFIKHLKALYQPERRPPVRIDTADGHDAGRILRTALKRSEIEQRDAIICLFDLDKDLPKGDLQKAKTKKFILIGAQPCIEGFMLDVLEKPKPHLTHDCKHKMHPFLGNKETAPSSYQIFTKALLENRRKTLADLDLILTLQKPETLSLFNDL